MRRRTAARTAGIALLAGTLPVACGLQRPPEVGEASLSGAERIACARTIVEGDVIDVHDARTGQHVVVTLAVADWIKPTHGRSTVSLDVPDPAAEHGAGYATGDHVLMFVLEPDGAPALSMRGEPLATYRSSLPRDLRRAKQATCPWWVTKL